MAADLLQESQKGVLKNIAGSFYSDRMTSSCSQNYRLYIEKDNGMIWSWKSFCFVHVKNLRTILCMTLQADAEILVAFNEPTPLRIYN